MILIVDDREDNLFALKHTLELNSFNVDVAQSGEEALKKILKNSYFLVILDVQMPNMDGFEVAQLMSQYSKSKDTPIIFLSAVNKEKKFITKGYTSGGIDYVTKPVDPDILLLKVKTFYKLSQQKRELKKIQASLLNEIEIRKQAQQEIETHNKELHSVMESLPQIAFTINKEEKIDYANNKWYSYSPDLITFPETHPKDYDFIGEWKKSEYKSKSFTAEIRLKKTGDHPFRYFLYKIIPVIQNDEIIKWVGTLTDIHPQKEANRLLEQKVEERTHELLNKNEELENSNQELQQVAWVISHDLKEPVRKMKTFSSLVRDKYLKDNEVAFEEFNKVIKAADRMSDLINDLVDFSKLSATNKFSKIDLNMVINDILFDFDTEIKDKKAEIQKGDLPTIDAIGSQIRQLFQNLISNALKFIQPNTPPKLKIESEFVSTLDFNSKVSKTGTYYRIKVQDNGIGFDEIFLDKIFLIFQRLESRNKYEGTGIGLAIAQKVIEKHNGIITAESAIDKGTTFIIVLPIHQN